MDDLHDELDAFIEENVDGIPEHLHDSTPISPPPDDDRANVLLRVLRRLERERADVLDVSRREIERIAAWRDDRCAGIDARTSTIERALEGYARSIGRKTLKLPNGELKLRSSRERVELSNVDEFMAWERKQVEYALRQFVFTVLDLEDVGDEEIAHIVELVQSQRTLVSVDVKPSKSEITRQAVAGPSVEWSDPDEEAHAVVIEGEPIPGLALVKSKTDAFSLNVPLT